MIAEDIAQGSHTPLRRCFQRRLFSRPFLSRPSASGSPVLLQDPCSLAFFGVRAGDAASPECGANIYLKKKEASSLGRASWFDEREEVIM